jgi:organic hydroperoxide reductase OsmC/OhrA
VFLLGLNKLAIAIKLSNWESIRSVSISVVSQGEKEGIKKIVKQVTEVCALARTVQSDIDCN